MNQAWPADTVERRPVASLLPYARNARTHSADQVAQIAAAIRAWGWTVPVLVDEAGQLIAGHGRVLAAKSLGLLDVPAMVARGWSEADKRAYALADNKLTLNAGWDADLLKGELFELRSEGFDLGVISGTTRELKLYRHMGFTPFGPLVGTPGAEYQPMYVTLDRFCENARANPALGRIVQPLLEQPGRKLSSLGCSCSHCSSSPTSSTSCPAP